LEEEEVVGATLLPIPTNFEGFFFVSFEELSSQSSQLSSFFFPLDLVSPQESHSSSSSFSSSTSFGISFGIFFV
jgi:hypothetical protein